MPIGAPPSRPQAPSPTSPSPQASSAQLVAQNQLPTLLILLVAGGLTSAVGSVVIPVFPEVVAQFQIDPRWAGLLFSMHTLTMAVASPIFGILADRIGKLRVLIPALLGYALFGAAGALMQGFVPILITRGLVGAASGGIAAASIGLISTMYEGEARSRIMGYATSALSTSTVILPLLGGWLGSFRWQYAFGLYLIAIPVALCALLVLKEPRRGAATVDLSQTQGLGRVLNQSSVLTLFLALALSSILFYVVVVYAPLHYREVIGASTVLNGAILSSRAIGAAVISALGASQIAKRFGVTTAISLGFGLMAVTLATIPLLTQAPLILLTALVFGLGFGLVMPNLYSGLSDLTPAAQRSGILAIGTGTASLGQFISPIVFGPIWKNAGETVFYAAAGVAIAISLLNLARRRTAR